MECEAWSPAVTRAARAVSAAARPVVCNASCLVRETAIETIVMSRGNQNSKSGQLSAISYLVFRAYLSEPYGSFCVALAIHSAAQDLRAARLSLPLRGNEPDGTSSGLTSPLSVSRARAYSLIV